MTFQMTKYVCTPCPYGMFKAEESTNPCTQWTNQQCPGASLGTRVSDSVCVDFPAPPENAVGVVDGGGWKCNAGYEIFN
jgi:hypothetical protein